MDRQQLRLEILKIVTPSTAHQGPANTIAAGQVFENWILENPVVAPVVAEEVEALAVDTPEKETNDAPPAPTTTPDAEKQPKSGGRKKLKEGNPLE